jgi:hypothetical protein
LHVEKSIEGGRVEASGSLSVAETIEVENPSVSSLLTTVQKYGEARGGSFKDIEVVVVKNASVEKMVGKQLRVGEGAKVGYLEAEEVVVED